jgi:hypothetical protein
MYLADFWARSRIVGAAVIHCQENEKKSKIKAPSGVKLPVRDTDGRRRGRVPPEGRPMSSGTCDAAELGAALLELARAFRARQFYPPIHPAFREALQSAEGSLRALLAVSARVELELSRGLFALPDGTPLRGPGIDELAQALACRRVRRLALERGLGPRELEALLEALCAGGVSARGQVGPPLALSGAPHVALETATGAEPCESGPAAPHDPDDDRVQLAAELERAVAELERAREPAGYKQAALRVERASDGLVRAKCFPNVYAAVQVLARHAHEPGRDARERAEAADRLGRVLRGDEMLGFVVEQACSTGLGSVQAAQILVEVGAMGVPRLLERVATASGEVRQQAAAVLVAMADHAFPLLVEELTSGDPARVKRAARLLGEMQHPRGVEFVVAHLSYPDGLVQKEVARALVRIGTDQAIGALVAALDGEPSTAEIVAAALGGSESRLALAALLRVADARARHSPLVRREAIRGLGRLQRPEAVPVLSAVLRRRAIFGRKRNRMLRVVAAQALGRIGSPEATTLLESFSRGGDPAVQRACLDSLRGRSQPAAE